MQVITQEELRNKVLPVLRERGKRYRKCSKVKARRAKSGERVVTRTADGLETKNVAKRGDFVVENQTKSKERYIVSSDTFEKRYTKENDLDDNWALYQSTGQVIGIKLTPELASEMQFKTNFEIEAPWGGTEVIRSNSYLVCPPDESEIYGIAEVEFNETYEPVKKNDA